MRRRSDVLIATALVAAGYLAGSSGLTLFPKAHAQAVVAETPPDVSPETAAKIKEARFALQAAMDALRNEDRYESITTVMNPSLILAGGGNAREDLETGRGVDPETFAALYAGQALPEIADHLSFDEKKRLMYQNQVVRMYSVSRLQQLFHEQLKFADPRL